jgi:predicted O-methyltransferase YrrM
MSYPQPAPVDVAALQKRVAELQDEITRYKADFRKDENESATLQYELAVLRQKAEHNEQLLRNIVDSDFWRITKPLRRLSEGFPRATAAIRAGMKAMVRIASNRPESTSPEADGASADPKASTEQPAQSEPEPQFDSRLESLLDSCPSVHGSVTYGLERDTLRFLDQNVAEGSRTLETGSGLSTLLFAYKSALHTCVTPWKLEKLRIEQHCAECGIPTERLRFAIGSSDEILPKLLDSGQLDLVLVDGGHGFPMPFVDWLYCAPRLAIGGILVIDDTHLWTGAVLRDFLLLESEWKLEASFARGSAFRKIKEFRNKEWNEQRYVLERSGQSG